MERCPTQEKNRVTDALTQAENKLESQRLQWHEEMSCPSRASKQSQLALEEKQQSVGHKQDSRDGQEYSSAAGEQGKQVREATSVKKENN